MDAAEASLLLPAVAVVIGVVLTFYAFAIVCHEYLVPVSLLGKGLHTPKPSASINTSLVHRSFVRPMENP